MIRRRDPRELMLLILCLMSGVSYLAGAEAPSSVEQVMPGWLLVAWYVSLTLAGVVGITGNLWPGALGTALLIRLSGQLLASGPAAAYALALVAFAGAAARFPASVVAVWAGVCLWTAKYLAEDVSILRGAR